MFVCTISPDDMREIYDVIIACESMAAELLAGLLEFERGTKANALEALNASMGVAIASPSDFMVTALSWRPGIL